MFYENGGIYIESDFPIRTLRQEESDIDLIIPVEDRTLNVFLEGMADYIGERLQFPVVKNIVIRLSTLKDVNRCTIHLLRNIDLHTSLVNFEIDYTRHQIIIKKKDYAIALEIKSK